MSAFVIYSKIVHITAHIHLKQFNIILNTVQDYHIESLLLQVYCFLP